LRLAPKPSSPRDKSQAYFYTSLRGIRRAPSVAPKHKACKDPGNTGNVKLRTIRLILGGAGRVAATSRVVTVNAINDFRQSKMCHAALSGVRCKGEGSLPTIHHGCNTGNSLRATGVHAPQADPAWTLTPTDCLAKDRQGCEVFGEAFLLAFAVSIAVRRRTAAAAVSLTSLF